MTKTKVIRNRCKSKANRYRYQRKLNKLSRTSGIHGRRVSKQLFPLPPVIVIAASCLGSPVPVCSINSTRSSNSAQSRCISPMSVAYNCVRVRFAEEPDKVFEIPAIPATDKAKFWWTKKEIKKFRRREQANCEAAASEG